MSQPQTSYQPGADYQSYGLNYHLEVDDNIHSVIDLLQPKFDQYREQTAFSLGAYNLSFGQLDEASRRFAAFLQAQGVHKGDRVAIQLPNIWQFPVAIVGCLRIGAVLVNINPMYTHYELAHQLSDSQSIGLIVLEGMAGAYEQLDDASKAQLKWVVQCSVQGTDASSNDIIALMQVGTPAETAGGAAGKSLAELSTPIKFTEVLAHYSAQDFIAASLSKDDLAVLQYTGGTTGQPKGAMLTQQNVWMNVVQCYEVFGDKVQSQVDGQVKILNPLPLYHIFSFSVCALLGMYAGWENILITNPRDMDGVMSILELKKPHIIPSVNTLFNGMLQHPQFSQLDFSDFQLAIGGGTAIIPAVAERWKAVTGKNIIEGYGMSETGPVVSFNPMNIQIFNATVGIPMPLTEVIILDDAGQRCAPGECGEVCVKGPQIMQGYWRKDNQETFTEDGYFKTGDIGFLDEAGFLKLVDRKKDMILVSGFNVYPNEVEAALTEHPLVVEVAVVGVADARSGEVPKAFVVKKDESLDEQALRDFAKERLTTYKQPQYYEFIGELPKTAVGKILRKELRS